MVTLESVLLEAERIDGSPEAVSKEENDDAATDYTDSGDEETDADPGGNDDEDTADTGNEDMGDEPMGDEDPGAEDADPGPDEGTDYTSNDIEGNEDVGADDESSAGDDSGMDDGNAGDSGVESEDQIKARNDKVKSYMLLKLYNRLYCTIKGFIEKVTSMDKKNLLFSAVQKTVTHNFDKLANLIYNYIQFYYDHMSYEYNLYTYNYFIETCKVNIELMNKVAGKDDIQYE